MGEFNSSKLLVKQVFDDLYALDKTGKSWLLPLLKLGTRSAYRLDNMTLGPLVQAPSYEHSVQPPKSLLKWLINNHSRLTSPPVKYWKMWAENTIQKRRALLENDVVVQSEALNALDTCHEIPDRAWWRLEGVTRVDCILSTSSAAIFIEGKKTEIGPSKRVLWYLNRNQVLRNLDCAAEYVKKLGLMDYFVIVIIEKDLVNNAPRRQEELRSITDPETIETSLPHLAQHERYQLMEHYLGVTTWQDIIDGFLSK